MPENPFQVGVETNNPPTTPWCGSDNTVNIIIIKKETEKEKEKKGSLAKYITESMMISWNVFSLLYMDTPQIQC